MISMFGLGLLPRGALLGAGLLVAAGAAVIAWQAWTINGLRDDLSQAEQAAAVAEAGANVCLGTVRQLESANATLAAAAAAQSEAVRGYVEASDRARAASAAAIAQAERSAAAHRRVAEDLAEVVRRKAEYIRPGECEAAAALRVVRERWQ